MMNDRRRQYLAFDDGDFQPHSEGVVRQRITDNLRCISVRLGVFVSLWLIATEGASNGPQR